LNMIMRSIYDGVADGFGMKVTRLGGLTPMRTVRDICKEARRPFSCDDSWGGDIVAAACVHLAATIEPSLSDGVWIAAPYLERNYDPVNGIQIRDGWIDVPKGPGLGITPDKVGWEEAGSFG
jgi:L-alanine-DL-glutamate epimerase-like enolase superfamily enzyme